MLKSKIFEKKKTDYNRKNPPIYKEYFIFIKDTSKIYGTIHEILNNTYYILLKQKGITDEDIRINHIEYAIKFINDIDKYYSMDKGSFDSPYFESYNLGSNFILTGLDINNDNFPYDKKMTIYEYFLLLKKMLKMYNNCFDVDYTKTCIKYDSMDNRITEFPKSNTNFSNILLNASGVYCRYIKNITNITNDNLDKIEPLFMGSYMVNKTISNILCIYNICSSVSKINESMKELTAIHNYKYKIFSNSKIFKDMLEYFNKLKTPQCDTYALSVVTTNPSFEKATLLYYNAGFKPMINVFETNNINMIESMYGECIEGQNKDEYLKCVDERHRNMLMMCTKGDYQSILYFNNNNKIRKDIIKRNDIITFPYFSGVEKFYSMTLAFSYKCSCILEIFLNKNKEICEYNMKSITDYYNINNEENRLITDYINKPFFQHSNVYINNVNNISFKDDKLRDTVNNEKELYRFIGSFSERVFDVSQVISNDILMLDNFISVFTEDGDGNKVLFKYNLVIGKYKVNYKDLETPYYTIGDSIANTNIFKYLNTKTQGSFGMKYIDIIILNLKIDRTKKYKYIFIPVLVVLKCTNEYSKYKSKEFAHAFSFLYDVDNKKLYYYETQLMYDIMTPYLIDSIKKTAVFVKNLLNELSYTVENDINNFFEKEDNLTDLTKYYSVNEKPIYCKIQSNYADDEKGSLCKILSFLPVVACEYMKDRTKEDRDLYIRFFMWFLYFSSIIIKQKHKKSNIDYGLRSNINYIFPYIYASVYYMIKDLNDKKRNSNGKHKITQEDIDIENKLEKNKNILLENIEELNRLIDNEIKYSGKGFISLVNKI